MNNKKQTITITQGDKKLCHETEFAICLIETEKGFMFSKVSSCDMVDDAFKTIVAAEALQKAIDEMLGANPLVKTILSMKDGKQFRKAVKESSVGKNISFEEAIAMTAEPFSEFKS